MDGLGERVQRAVKLAGGAPAAAKATATGVSTIYKYQKPDGGPPISFLDSLATAAGVRREWLFFGELPEKPSDEAGDWETRLEPASPGEKRVPIYHVYASAGSGAFPLDEEPAAWVSYPLSLLRALGDPDSLDFIRVSGDSMEPELRDQDLVLVDRSRTEFVDGLVVAWQGDTLLIKRLQVLSGRRAQLVSTNPAYPPIEVDLAADSNFRIVGRAVYAGKQL